MEPKKSTRANLEQKRPMFFGIGMVISLSLTLVAFEWKSPIDPVIFDIEGGYIISCPIFPDSILLETKTSKTEAPLTFWDLNGNVFTNDDQYGGEPLESGSLITCPLPPFNSDNTEEDSILMISEIAPSYKGGNARILEFIENNLTYPKQAKRLGVEGRVFVGFVVEKDGSLTDLHVIKGIGAGCDEEALRVMKLVPDFLPGKQNDETVRVKMIVPIHFKL